MKTLRHILIGLTLLIAPGLRAQNHIVVESINGFPSQALFNEQYTTLSVVLHNLDSAGFTGDIRICFHTSDSLNSGVDSLSFGGPYLISMPGDTITEIMIATFEFSPNSFKMGGNVVVVWPRSYNGSMIFAPDSFMTYVEITGYAGINDISVNNNTGNIYPVPADEIIYLPKNSDGEKIESVKITDMLGRTRVMLRNYPVSISVAELENGFYFFEVTEKSGKTRVTRFSVNH